MTGFRQHQTTRTPLGQKPVGEGVYFADGPKLIGKTVTLTSGALVAGIATPGALLSPNVPLATLEDTVGPPPPAAPRLTNFNINEQILSYEGPAAHYVVSTQGKIQQPGFNPGDPDPLTVAARTFPFSCFVINWTIGGTNFETRVDGNSDQFLGLVAERVTVSARWDEENGTTILTTPRYYPAAMSMAASLSRGDGLPSKAYRTRLLPTSPDPPFGFIPGVFIPIPYAAKGYIVRNGSGPTAFVTRPGANNVDSYTAADVLAAHGRGEYLSVPSVADFLTQGIIAVPAGFPMVEFQMYM